MIQFFTFTFFKVGGSTTNETRYLVRTAVVCLCSFDFGDVDMFFLFQLLELFDGVTRSRSARTVFNVIWIL